LKRLQARDRRLQLITINNTVGLKKKKIVFKLVSFFLKNGDLGGQLRGFLKILSNIFFIFKKTAFLKNYLNTEEFNFIINNNQYYKNIANILN